MLPVGLLNRVLLKKVVIAALVAAAEVVILSAGKRKRKSRGASPVPGRAPKFFPIENRLCCRGCHPSGTRAATSKR